MQSRGLAKRSARLVAPQNSTKGKSSQKARAKENRGSINKSVLEGTKPPKGGAKENRERVNESVTEGMKPPKG
jgi:hypothetical protein